jgi:hypothetical protein
MALWDDLVGSWTGNIVLGAAALLVAPLVLPAVLAGVRPLAKLGIQGGVWVYETTTAMVAEIGEQMSDLVAEARAELTTS